MVAYKREGYDMFETMIAAIQDETVRRICIARVKERVERKRGGQGHRRVRLRHV